MPTNKSALIAKGIIHIFYPNNKSCTTPNIDVNGIIIIIIII